MRSINLAAATVLAAFFTFAPGADAIAADRPGKPARAAGIGRNPYIGAIVIDAADGRVLFEDNADAAAQPASVIKLMNLLIILEKVKAGALRLDEQVKVTAESAKMGGSQVYLKEGESFTIDELLYALVVQSANDAATALAIHVAGSKQAFVDLMNQKAKAMGMTGTAFQSVHGLPPGKGQLPDVMTTRDVGRLCLELSKHPEAFVYTSTQKKPFRQGDRPFVMETHNHLLKNFDGCDGFKTGFYRAAGYSCAVTAQRNGRRIIAVVLGTFIADGDLRASRTLRDTKAAELLTKGFVALPAAGTPAAVPPAPAGSNPSAGDK